MNCTMLCIICSWPHNICLKLKQVKSIIHSLIFLQNNPFYTDCFNEAWVPVESSTSWLIVSTLISKTKHTKTHVHHYFDKCFLYVPYQHHHQLIFTVHLLCFNLCHYYYYSSLLSVSREKSKVWKIKRKRKCIPNTTNDQNYCQITVILLVQSRL